MESDGDTSFIEWYPGKRVRSTVRHHTGILSPQWFGVPLLLILSLFGAMVLVLTSMRLMYPDRYPDPFAPYHGLMPGQSVRALKGYTCHRYNFPFNSTVTCEIPLRDVHFRRISLTADVALIQAVVFEVVELQVVDLVEHWGTPDTIQSYGQDYRLSWHEGVSAVARPVGRFNYQASVRSVTVIKCYAPTGICRYLI